MSVVIVTDVHLLLGLNYFGFQISRDDSPSGIEVGSGKSSAYLISYQTVCLWVKYYLLSAFRRIRFSVPKPRAALAFLME